MAKIIILLGLAVLFVFSVNALNFGACPPLSQMTSCSPKCIQDTECSKEGGLCCPNACNFKSCARPKSGSHGSSSGAYKGSSVSSATGKYCGNVKCPPNKVCGLDQNKREACVESYKG